MSYSNYLKFKIKPTVSVLRLLRPALRTAVDVLKTVFTDLENAR